eukprot:13459-Heterococcus_DN1.PRE.2
MAMLTARCYAFVQSAGKSRSALVSNAQARIVQSASQTRSSALMMTAEQQSRRGLFAKFAATSGAALAWASTRTNSNAQALANDVLRNDAVSHLQRGNTDVYLIGTAHISEASADLVRDVIRQVKVRDLSVIDSSSITKSLKLTPIVHAAYALQPDTVMIELDSSRIKTINKIKSVEGSALAERGPEQTAALARKAEDMLSPPAQDAARATSSNSSTTPLITRVLGGVLGKLLSSLYKNLDGKGFESGKEFRVAIAEAQAVNAKILLGDRPVQKTLDALAAAIRATGYRKLISADLDAVQLQAAGLDPSSSLQMDRAGISSMMETLKTREKVRSLMTGIKSELPLLYNAMVRERDQYMATSLGGYLQTTGNKCAVGVVGIAHMDGIEEFLQQDFGYKLVNPRRA